DEVRTVGRAGAVVRPQDVVVGVVARGRGAIGDVGCGEHVAAGLVDYRVLAIPRIGGGSAGTGRLGRPAATPDAERDGPEPDGPETNELTTRRTLGHAHILTTAGVKKMRMFA